MRIVLFNYTGDRTNWGCQATSRSLLEQLRVKYNNAELILFDLDPIRPWARLLVAVGTPLLSYVMRRRRPDRLSFWQKAFLNLFALCVYGRRARLIRGADLSVLQAEGTMFRYRGRTVRLFFGPYFSRAVGVRKVVSTNQTVFSGDTRIDELIRSVYDCMDFVAVRELESLDLLLQLGIRHACFAPDAAFLTQPSPTDRVEAILRAADLTSRYIVVAGSAGTVPVESIVRLAEALYNRFLVPVVFIASAADDQPLASAVSRSAGIHVLRHTDLDYRDVCGILLRSELFISGRFHLCILSACVGTPMIILNTNTHKNEGLRRVLDWPFPVTDVSDTHHILEHAETIWAQRDSLASQLTTKVELFRQTAAQALGWD